MPPLARSMAYLSAWASICAALGWSYDFQWWLPRPEGRN